MDLRTKALQNHYKNVYLEHGNETFWMVIDPNDIGTWYVLIHNLDGDNKGGEYLMRMTAPNNYPFGPPKFELFTPNPRYEIGKSRPCVSMGEYHPEGYPALLGMYGFACEIAYSISVPGDEMGAGISIKMKVSSADKQEMAKKSVEYNKKHYPEVMKLFEEERTRVFKNPLEYNNSKITKPSKQSNPPKSSKSTKSSKSSKSSRSSKSIESDTDSDESFSEQSIELETNKAKSTRSSKPVEPMSDSSSSDEPIKQDSRSSKTNKSKSKSISKKKKK